MRILGLTGPSGAGKGALAELFLTKGIPVIDADRVYHELLIPPSNCINELVEVFGAGILTPDGTLDRAVMASMVFGKDDASKQRLAVLNRITHRYVWARTEELLDEYRRAEQPLLVIDAPLLLEAGMDGLCDLVVAVLADRDVRLARLMARDGKGRDAITARIDAQPNDIFYRERADIVVYNNGDIAALHAQADKALRAAGVTL